MDSRMRAISKGCLGKIALFHRTGILGGRTERKSGFALREDHTDWLLMSKREKFLTKDCGAGERENRRGITERVAFGRPTRPGNRRSRGRGGGIRPCGGRCRAA